MAYYDEATIHGISKIHNTKSKYGRMVWIIVLFAFSASFLYFLTKNLITYYKYEMTVSTTVKATKEALRLPSVALCNSNRANRIRLNKLYLEVYRDGNFDDLVQNLNVDEGTAIGQQPNEFFVGTCQFNQLSCSKQINESFVLYPTIVDGNCFIFNYNGSKYQLKPGYQYGLHVVVDIDQDSYLYDDFDENSLRPAGVLVSLQHENSQPDLDNTALAPPNQLTRISVQKSTITRLKAPFPDNCQDEKDISTPIIKHGAYTQQNCFESCLIFSINDTCEALDFERFLATKLSNYSFKLSSSSEDDECIKNVKDKFIKKQIPCSCPPLCYAEEYDYKLNSALWPAKIAEEKWIPKTHAYKRGDNVTTDYVKQNLVAIQVFYGSFKIVETVHTAAYSFENFLASLGGILGLWIGASIFSIIELLVFATESCSKKLIGIVHKEKIVIST